MDFSSAVLTIEPRGHVAVLWLDRPEKRNAMSQEVVRDLPRAMAAIAADDAIRAVVIAARGKSFCVGLDLTDLMAAPSADRVEKKRRGNGEPAADQNNTRVPGRHQFRGRVSGARDRGHTFPLYWCRHGSGDSL